MKVYAAHAKGFDFHTNWYEPIKQTSWFSDEVILPHEKTEALFDSKTFLQSCDVMIAEVTYAATGLGIEIGWANMMEVPIICFYEEGKKLSSSVKMIADVCISYRSTEELQEKLNELKKYLKKT